MDALYHKEPKEGSRKFHGLLVTLYADYAKEKLLSFLRSSDHYPIQEALDTCQKRGYIPEMVFLLGDYSQTFFLGALKCLFSSKFFSSSRFPMLTFIRELIIISSTSSVLLLLFIVWFGKICLHSCRRFKIALVFSFSFFLSFWLVILSQHFFFVAFHRNKWIQISFLLMNEQFHTGNMFRMTLCFRLICFQLEWVTRAMLCDWL